MTNPRVFNKNFKSILKSTFKYYFLQKQRDRLEEHVFAITFDYFFYSQLTGNMCLVTVFLIKTILSVCGLK